MANKTNTKMLKQMTLVKKEPKKKEEPVQTAAVTEEKKPTIPVDKEQADKNKKIKSSKTALKATGMKSALILDENTVLITSFGKGNDAVLEKKIVNQDIQSVGAEGALDVTHLDKPTEDKTHKPDSSYLVQGRRPGAVASYADNPLKAKSQGDLIGARGALETRYFGKNFADNIHVQLAYCILDIEKILAPQVTNIAMKLNALNRKDGESDVIGNLGAGFIWDKEDDLSGTKKIFDDPKYPEKKQAVAAYMKEALLPYFYNVFYKNDTKRDESEIFAVLSVIGELRQFCFEETRGQSAERNSLYNLNHVLSQKAKDVLSDLYKTAFSNLNKDFLGNNALINLPTLFDVLDANTEEKKQAVIKDFYLYVAKKDWKNLGFSIKELRETMLSQKFPQLTALNVRDDKEFGTVRGKLYTLLDFLMARYYVNDDGGKERAKALNAELRTLLYKNEQERLEARRCIYDKEAVKYWSGNSAQIIKLVGRLKSIAAQEKRVSKKKKTAAKTAFAKKYQAALNEVKLQPTPDPFCHVIYLLTMVQNGKEINDMMTSLVHCFDNIAGFLDVMQECGINCEFVQQYKFFAKADEYATQMRLILSFARMQRLPKTTEKLLFIDAIHTLGYSMSDEECDTYVDSLLDEEKSNKLSEKDAGVRYFIANNVLNSARFRYMIEYVKPATARIIAQNKALVTFVLSDVPATQIDRYYKQVTGKETLADKSVKIAELVKVIAAVKFDDFKKVDQKADAWKAIEEAPEADAYKAKQLVILSLFLTVIYLAVKNLVNVNARYVMAFHALERDRLLLTGENKKAADILDLVNHNIKQRREEVTALRTAWEQLPAEKRGKYGPPTHDRVADYLEQDVNNCDNNYRQKFRNDVTHLNLLRDMDAELRNVKAVSSYYALYHYLEQQRLFKLSPAVEGKTEKKYAENVIKFGAYSKDFVKALCAPFGYNLPRFKNLSIEELFDKNKPDDKAEEKKESN